MWARSDVSLSLSSGRTVEGIGKERKAQLRFMPPFIVDFS